jgi:hypothetical protein
MCQRAATNEIECAFAYNEEGYRQFAKAIGPIPDGMAAPTVGRWDHNQGYVPGNFRWQEKADNSSEVAVRIGLSRRGGLAVRDSSKFNARQIVVCPHCGRVGKLPPMKRWHFERCRG